MPEESCGLEVLRLAGGRPLAGSLVRCSGIHRWSATNTEPRSGCSLILEDHHRHRAAFSMSDGKRNSVYAELFGNLCGSAVQLEDWPSPRCVADFNTGPCDSARGSRAQRLHRRFFGSEARCKSLDRVPLASAVPNFSWREDLLQESIAKTGNRRSNAGNFADVNTCADDHIATGSWQAGRGTRDFESTDSLR